MEHQNIRGDVAEVKPEPNHTDKVINLDDHRTSQDPLFSDQVRAEYDALVDWYGPRGPSVSAQVASSALVMLAADMIRARAPDNNALFCAWGTLVGVLTGGVSLVADAEEDGNG